MAAREDEPQPVVGLDGISRSHRPLQQRDLVAVTPVPPKDVDGTAPRGSHEPRARSVRDAFEWPFFERCDQAVLNDLLSEIEISDEADEGSGQASGFLAEDGAHPLPCQSPCFLPPQPPAPSSPD